MPKYLIIGNSAGGLAAVEAIREVDAQGSITVLSQEPYPVYSRPRLTQFLGGECTEEDLWLQPAYQNQPTRQVDFRLRVKAQNLNLKAKEVVTTEGERIAWEKLLLAVGGESVIAPQWAGRERVLTLNSLDEAKAIIRALSQGTRVVVLGAGLIGVSAAKALARRGTQVSLVAGSPRVLSTFLDEEASALAEKALTQGGVRVVTESRGESIDQGSPITVTLGKGEVIDADLVIVGRGVRPNVEIAKGTSLRVEEGIVVNRHMETSVPHVYACGDVAQTYDALDGQSRVNANWPNAFMGGRVAGYNMAGRRLTFEGLSFNSLNLLGLPIMAAGKLTPEKGWEVLYRRRQGVYQKLLLYQGRVMGLVMVGDIRRSGIILNLMRERIEVESFQQSLLAEDFGLASLPTGLRHKLFEKAKTRDERATAV